MSKKGKKLVKRPQPEPDFSPESDYWLALGQFVEAFALAEGMLFMYLIYSVKINKLVGKALFGRLRCEELIKGVRRTWDVAPPSPSELSEIDAVLTQLALINGVRNDVIHNRSHVFPDRGRVSTNLLRAHTPFKVVERRVSPSLLMGLTQDLGKITLHLASIRLQFNDTFEQRAAAEPSLRDEWQYKGPPTTH